MYMYICKYKIACLFFSSSNIWQWCTSNLPKVFVRTLRSRLEQRRGVSRWGKQRSLTTEMSARGHRPKFTSFYDRNLHLLTRSINVKSYYTCKTEALYLYKKWCLFQSDIGETRVMSKFVDNIYLIVCSA